VRKIFVNKEEDVYVAECLEVGTVSQVIIMKVNHEPS